MTKKIIRLSIPTYFKQLIIFIGVVWGMHLWLDSRPKRHQVSDREYYVMPHRLNLADKINDFRYQHGIFSERNIALIRNNEKRFVLLQAEQVKKQLNRLIRQAPAHSALFQDDFNANTEASALQQAFAFMAFAKTAVENSVGFDQSNTVNANGMTEVMNNDLTADLIEDAALSHRVLNPEQSKTKQIVLNSSIKQFETIENLEK